MRNTSPPPVVTSERVIHDELLRLELDEHEARLSVWAFDDGWMPLRQIRRPGPRHFVATALPGAIKEWLRELVALQQSAVAAAPAPPVAAGLAKTSPRRGRSTEAA